MSLCHHYLFPSIVRASLRRCVWTQRSDVSAAERELHNDGNSSHLRLGIINTLSFHTDGKTDWVLCSPTSFHPVDTTLLQCRSTTQAKGVKLDVLPHRLILILIDISFRYHFCRLDQGWKTQLYGLLLRNHTASTCDANSRRNTSGVA